MKQMIVMIFSFLLITLAKAAELNIYRSSWAKPQLIVAFKDNHPTTGTDIGTVSHPNAGLNTVPTRNTGTETNAQDSPLPDLNNPQEKNNNILVPNPNMQTQEQIQ